MIDSRFNKRDNILIQGYLSLRHLGLYETSDFKMTVIKKIINKLQKKIDKELQND